MTREEAIYCMKSYIDDSNYEHCTSCPYYEANQIGENIFVCNSGEAHKMAIASLEAWDIVRKEIEEYMEKKWDQLSDSDKIIVTGITTIDDWKYHMAESTLDIINRHLQEVEE